MINPLWSSICIYLTVTYHVKTVASTNLDDIVYTTPNSRLTISTPKPKSRIDQYLFTCMKVDKYTHNQIIYCGYSDIVQLKSDGSKWRINTISGFEKAALQLDARYWLLAVLDGNCILKVSFSGRGSQGEFAGCHGEGNDDGVGTSATFDQPRDMVYNKFHKNEVVVLTRTKLRLLDVNTARVSTYPLTLPEGFTQIVWYKNSLIFLSKFFYGMVHFLLSGEVSEVYFSKSDMINWVSLSVLPSVAFQTSYTHYITDVAPAGHPGLFLLNYKEGKLGVFDMINKRTEILDYNNSCLGEQSSFVVFNFQKFEVIVAYSGELCVATISWTDLTTTSPTTTLTTAPSTSLTLTTRDSTTGSLTTLSSTTTSTLKSSYLNEVVLISGALAIISSMALTAYFILTMRRKKRRRKIHRNIVNIQKQTDVTAEQAIPPMWLAYDSTALNQIAYSLPDGGYKVIESQQMLDLQPVFSQGYPLDAPVQPTQ